MLSDYITLSSPINCSINYENPEELEYLRFTKIFKEYILLIYFHNFLFNKYLEIN